MKHNSRKLGFSMIEVLISVLLVTLIASASLTLHYNSFVLADKAGLQTQAYYLTKAGVERVKVIRLATAKEGLENFFDANVNGTESNMYGVNIKKSIDEISLTTTFDQFFSNSEDDYMKIELGGSRFLRFITFKQFSTDTHKKFMQIRVGVCYGKAAVSLVKCNEAKSESKNYVETIAVIRNKD